MSERAVQKSPKQFRISTFAVAGSTREFAVRAEEAAGHGTEACFQAAK